MTHLERERSTQPMGLPSSDLALTARKQKLEESDRIGGAWRVRERSVDSIGRAAPLPSSADIASGSAAQRGALTSSIGKKKGVQGMKIPAPGARD